MSNDKKAKVKNEGSDGETSQGKAPYMLVTQSDFAAVSNLEAPLIGRSSMDCSNIHSMYHQATIKSKQENRDAEFRVFCALAAVASFGLRVDNPLEPFVSMIQIGGRRTALPEDFRGEPAIALYENIGHFENPALRARIADTVWFLDPKRADAGYDALRAYTEAARILCSGNDGEDGLYSPFLGADYLGRALTIARRIGWEKDESLAVRKLLQDARKNIPGDHRAAVFMRLATHDINHGVSDAGIVARESEEIIKGESDVDIQRELWRLAARDYAQVLPKFDKERDKCLSAAGHCSIRMADEAKTSIGEVHFLEQAIADFQKVNNSKDLRTKLRKRLYGAQAGIFDEMRTFHYKEDISENVKKTRERVSGQSLMGALRGLMLSSTSPNPEELRENAKEMIAQFPLSYLISSTRYDENKRPIERTAGKSSLDEIDETAIRQGICEWEAMRRGLTTSGNIYPAIQIISVEHNVGSREIAFLCRHSPFIPPDRVEIYTEGFMRFLRGDMIAALHILIPQLENSIRCILEQLGIDISTLKSQNMTQEVMSLSTLFDKFKENLEQIFGPALVMDIDNVFNYRGGLHLRDKLSHGLMNDDSMIGGHEMVYACWLIFHISFVPLLRDWDKLTSRIKTIRGETSQ